MAAENDDGNAFNVDEDRLLLQDDKDNRELCAICRKWRNYCCALAVILPSVLLFLAVNFVNAPTSYLSNKADGSHSLIPGQDLFRTVSNMRVKFNLDQRYSGPAGDNAWKALYSSLGLVKVKEGQETELGAPVNFLGQQGYSVSVFHQLHCLDLIRHKIYDIPMHHENSTAWHIDHCFDYLRQALMCNADTALEHAIEKGGQFVEGWDVWHECRDWNELRRVAERQMLES